MTIGRTRAAWHRDRKIRFRKDDQCLDAAMPTSPRQWHRPNEQRSEGEPELSALFTGTPAHLVAAEIARLQQAVGNRGAAALLAPRPGRCEHRPCIFSDAASRVAIA